MTLDTVPEDMSLGNELRIEKNQRITTFSTHERCIRVENNQTLRARCIESTAHHVGFSVEDEGHHLVGTIVQLLPRELAESILYVPAVNAEKSEIMYIRPSAIDEFLTFLSSVESVPQQPFSEEEVRIIKDGYRVKLEQERKTRESVAMINPELSRNADVLCDSIWVLAKAAGMHSDASAEYEERAISHEKTHYDSIVVRENGRIDTIIHKQEQANQILKRYVGSDKEELLESQLIISHVLELAHIYKYIQAGLEAEAMIHEILTPSYSPLVLASKVAPILVDYQRQGKNGPLAIDDYLQGDWQRMHPTGVETRDHEAGTMLLLFGETFNPERIAESVNILDVEEVPNQEQMKNDILDRASLLLSDPKKAMAVLAQAEPKIVMLLERLSLAYEEKLNDFYAEYPEVFTEAT